MAALCVRRVTGTQPGGSTALACASSRHGVATVTLTEKVALAGGAVCTGAGNANTSGIANSAREEAMP